MGTIPIEIVAVGLRPGAPVMTAIDAKNTASLRSMIGLPGYLSFKDFKAICRASY
jgi:hypothetical protein